MVTPKYTIDTAERVIHEQEGVTILKGRNPKKIHSEEQQYDLYVVYAKEEGEVVQFTFDPMTGDYHPINIEYYNTE